MAEGKLSGRDLAIRWVMGLVCVALEVTIVALVIHACVRVIGSNELFFWHPMLLSIGLILFLSHGVRAYTALAGLSRTKVRLIHGFLSGTWLCLAIAGFSIIEEVKEEIHHKHFTSLHGRLGLGVLFFSLVQGIAGSLKFFVLFRTNQRFLRWHGRLGTLIYASALTTFLSGVMQKFESDLQDVAIAIYVLTFVLAVIVLFFDFWVKGADLLPEHGPAQRDSIKMRTQDGQLYLPVNDSHEQRRNLLDA